jgi:hypothetical protein
MIPFNDIFNRVSYVRGVEKTRAEKDRVVLWKALMLVLKLNAHKHKHPMDSAECEKCELLRQLHEFDLERYEYKPRKGKADAKEK